MGWLVERRLSKVAAQLKRARAELSVVGEQAGALTDDADDARIRSIVADSKMADHEHRESQRHADAMASARRDLVERIRVLERTQDELLDKLSSSSRSR